MAASKGTGIKKSNEVNCVTSANIMRRTPIIIVAPPVFAPNCLWAAMPPAPWHIGNPPESPIKIFPIPIDIPKRLGVTRWDCFPQKSLQASDAAIAAEINSIDAFRQDGVFSKERYQRVLRNQGMSPGQFEWTLKRELVANQMKSGIAFTAAATTDDFSRIYRLEAQQRRFDHLLLPQSLVADRVTVSDEDIEAYYSNHNDAYMSREQVRVQYIEMA